MASTTGRQLRLAELMAAISLATDLGTGQPMDHALRTCYLAMGLAREVGASGQELFDTYYVSLLRFVGCTAEATPDAALNAGNEIAMYAGLAPVLMGRSSEMLGWMVRHLAEDAPRLNRARSLASGLTDPKGAERAIRAHCETGQMLSSRIGLGASVLQALGCAFERWDGKGLPNGIAGEGIPLASRIAIIARDFELLNRVWGNEAASDIINKRKGRAYEPRLVEVALEHGPDLSARMDEGSIWDHVLEAEPGPALTVDDNRCNDVLQAFALFVDLKSPYFHGHSSGVAELAERAATTMSLAEDEIKLVKRAGWLHDLGRVAVPSGIWNKAGGLSDGEWEQVRLHPYYTERILTRCTPLSNLAVIASSHHERIDGSGYHRRVEARSLSVAARVLAAADAFRAMTEPRPHRPQLSHHQAADELHRACAGGQFDVECARAVMEAGGEAPRKRPSSWPAGLTDREVEVVRLIASGLSNREIARRLTLSPKTVGHHIQHIYGKIDVTTRAGATLYALENGLAGH